MGTHSSGARGVWRIPGAGGTQRLPRLIGLRHALEMITIGKPIKAEVAHQRGLVDDVVKSEKLIDAAVEETLRFDAPVQFLMRKATHPMHYHGQDVAAGENVTVVMAAANRDPEIYEQPDQFRLDRKKNHHHTFGFGIHFCIGAPLARMEARLALKALTGRFARLQRPARPPGENERVASPLLRGFHHLWLTLQE